MTDSIIPISSAIAAWQTQIATAIGAAAADQRAGILKAAEEQIGAIYYAAPEDSPTRSQALAAWTQINALADHAAQQEAIAAGATAAAQQIATEHAALAKEHGDLIDDLDRIDLDNPRVVNIHRDGYHTGLVTGYNEGQESALSQIDMPIMDAHYPLMRQHIPIHEYAAKAFLRLVWDQDWLLDDLPQEMKQELADFVHNWTRRALVDLYVDPPDAGAALNDIAWWDRGYTIDDFIDSCYEGGGIDE